MRNIYFGISTEAVSTLIFCMCREGSLEGAVALGKVTKLSRVTFIGKTFRYNQNKIQFHFHLDTRTDGPSPTHDRHSSPRIRPSVRPTLVFPFTYARRKRTCYFFFAFYYSRTTAALNTTMITHKRWLLSGRDARASAYVIFFSEKCSGIKQWRRKSPRITIGLPDGGLAIKKILLFSIRINLWLPHPRDPPFRGVCPSACQFEVQLDRCICDSSFEGTSPFKRTTHVKNY